MCSVRGVGSSSSSAPAPQAPAGSSHPSPTVEGKETRQGAYRLLSSPWSEIYYKVIKNGNIPDIMSFSYSSLAVVFPTFSISNAFYFNPLSLAPSGQAGSSGGINYFLELVAIIIFFPL